MLKNQSVRKFSFGIFLSFESSSIQDNDYLEILEALVCNHMEFDLFCSWSICIIEDKLGCSGTIC